MKVTFIKDHLENKKGATADVDEARANYWIQMGVVEASDGTVKRKSLKNDNRKSQVVTKKATSKKVAPKKSKP